MNAVLEIRVRKDSFNESKKGDMRLHLYLADTGLHAPEKSDY